MCSTRQVLHGLCPFVNSYLMDLLYLVNICAYLRKLNDSRVYSSITATFVIVMHNVKGICQVPKREFDKGYSTPTIS